MCETLRQNGEKVQRNGNGQLSDPSYEKSLFEVSRKNIPNAQNNNL